jgi:hypothetical protein
VIPFLTIEDNLRRVNAGCCGTLRILTFWKEHDRFWHDQELTGKRQELARKAFKREMGEKEETKKRFQALIQIDKRPSSGREGQTDQLFGKHLHGGVGKSRNQIPQGNPRAEKTIMFVVDSA